MRSLRLDEIPDDGETPQKIPMQYNDNNKTSNHNNSINEVTLSN